MKDCFFPTKKQFILMSHKQIFLWICNTYMERVQYNHLLMVIWRDHHILLYYDPLKQTAATLAAAWFSLNHSAALACLVIINHTLFFSWTLKSVRYSKSKMSNNSLYVYYTLYSSGTVSFKSAALHQALSGEANRSSPSAQDCLWKKEINGWY